MARKEYTLADFAEVYVGEKKIEESGQLLPDFCGLNYSDSLSRLISEAGRWCERYASDLFIDWQSIVEKLENRTIKSGSYLFGFRRDGVDHTSFLLNAYNGCVTDSPYNYYRAIWRLDVEVSDGHISFTTYKIQIPY